MKTSTIQKARSIERTYGSNYYLATLFLPKAMREAVFVLYAFVRIPDEMVDNPIPGSDPAQLLQDWKVEWQHTYDTGEGRNDIMLATREVFLRYDIPFSVSIEFIDAMILDLHKSTYETYNELQRYMRGSAEVVGVMLTKVFGCENEAAFPYAEKLGEAMQFTNFLRDIKEDFEVRARVYLPADDLETFKVTTKDFIADVPSPELIALLRFEITRARGLFRAAEPGIELLPTPAKRAVRLAARFYEGILDGIERNHYHLAAPKASLSPLQKCRLIITSYVK
jgi:phytoene synthase